MSRSDEKTETGWKIKQAEWHKFTDKHEAFLLIYTFNNKSRFQKVHSGLNFIIETTEIDKMCVAVAEFMYW
jgi:hypothetical protein